jgi:putative SOS response-associated peptidase YedK
MCGRYTHKFTWKQIHKLYTGTAKPEDMPESFNFEANYNVAPSQLAPVGREIDGVRRLDMLRWGLIPFWAKDEKIGNSLINARADTVASKPAFREAFKSRRCLVPASGFYEWQKLDEKRKQPHYIQLASEEPMFFAGLWERWTPSGDEPVESYTILTTEPNELMASIHNRMPVILEPERFGEWLAKDTPPEKLSGLLKPYPAELMMATPVSTLVNNPRNNQPECIAPLVE